MAVSSEIPFQLGFPSVHTSTRYYSPYGLNLGTNSSPQGDLRLCPFWIPTAGVYDRIGIEITTIGEAGSVVRLGIYAADQQQYTPLLQAPLLDAGTVAGDGSTGFKEITISQTLTAGLVWLGDVGQLCPTTPPQRRGVTTASGLYPASSTNSATLIGSAGTWQTTGVTGALPNWSAANVSGGTVVSKIWLRKA